MTRVLLSDTSKVTMIPSDIRGLYYTLRPGATSEHFSFNSLGYNMPERPAQKPEGHWRIMIVGDSVTQGVGADSRDDAYPNKTEQLLRQRLHSKKVEVWNCGTGGYNVDQVFLMMSHIVANYAPDVIIYSFCFNDYWGPDYFLSGQAAQRANAESVSGSVGFLDRIKQLRAVVQAVGLYDRLHYRIYGYMPAYVDHKISYPSWVAMKLRITGMRDFCRARGWPFAVSIVPYPQFLYVDDSCNLALYDLRAFLGKENIPFCDATPTLRNHKAESLFTNDGGHPNSRGYELIAENLAGWIVTNRATILPP